jgi:hypothetical protein
MDQAFTLFLKRIRRDMGSGRKASVLSGLMKRWLIRLISMSMIIVHYSRTLRAGS